MLYNERVFPPFEISIDNNWDLGDGRVLGVTSYLLGDTLGYRLTTSGIGIWKSFGCHIVFVG